MGALILWQYAKMKKRLFKIICCPRCSGKLELKVFLKEKDEIKEGMLFCKECGIEYPIYNYIPRMIYGNLLEIPRWFIEKYNFIIKNSEHKIKMVALKKDSSEVFGEEWAIANKWGYKTTSMKSFKDHKGLLVEDSFEYSLAMFKRISFLKEEDLKGKFVLDAGAGVGRYSLIASEMGAEVVALDIANSIDYTLKNLKDRGVHIIQGDLSCLPFKRNVFDVVFCLQVIMHTPSPTKSFRSLASVLKPDGRISVTAYAKGNIFYELNNKFIRFFTTKMPKKMLWGFSAFLSWIGRIIILNKYLFAGVNAFVRIKPNKTAMFDWYAPKVASHHTDKEMRRWFKENSIRLLYTDDPRVNPKSFHARIYPRFTRTQEGKVRRFFYSMVPRWGISMSGIKK